jgi:hypothetical protein|tara:strand:- start:872 stop:1243 length:372 start_codon:yes stop_codon:yes gene_type:complete
MSEVTLVKTNFGRTSYTQTINTEFTQLVPPSPVIVENNLPTVNDFFNDYNALFFQIPKTGENSHTTLIESSTEYIGYNPQSQELQALQQEITFLREQLLTQRQQLESLSANPLNQVGTLTNGN